ncbi:hypothetical protein [Bosea sp. ASV33]|uniref:hypothetical protein n=1 Tax=Bosea sp. ASV33 TaxID=2795106 RepID=UPI0018ECF1FE|nr:hypothetical protein [Bosea sp. ASV33]
MTTTNSAARIDRRVQVTIGSSQTPVGVHRVSNLRGENFVVLLGEPGMGKSVVLGQEAELEGTTVVKVRELIHGLGDDGHPTLFLDALDEYRSDGHAGDKAYFLAKAMIAAAPTRWRISCRSEDWRKDADITPIQRTAGAGDIVVAQLLPLDNNEAVAVLRSLGEEDADQFLEKAFLLGANGFTESPLSLKLLHAAVARAGRWPKTRFELFASAVQNLSFEPNSDLKFGPRHSITDIVDVASEASLLLLTTGATTIWRSGGVPPAGADSRAHLQAQDVRADHGLMRDTLNTALFRGEGEGFEPIHRTVAEFLGGKALAEAVNAAGDRAALPLSRAIALITGHDAVPPTELRGLYAWFAAHLANLKNEGAVQRLIEADAGTVLAYGDAAVFSTDTRRSILSKLNRNDPHFRNSDAGVTAFGGLSGEDLAGDFRAILADPAGSEHLALTVFDALASGTPVMSLRPLLREIALDPNRVEWHRRRAAEAWLNGAQDRAASLRQLFDDLAPEPASPARESLRCDIAVSLPRAMLTSADIRSLLGDFDRCSSDDTILRLFQFKRTLLTEPDPTLFDISSATWRPSVSDRRRTEEVDDLIDDILASTIRKTSGLSGAKIWQWIENSRSDPSSDPGNETIVALSEWLDLDPAHEVDLFSAILDGDEPTKSPRRAGFEYTSATRRRPSEAIIRSVLDKASASPDHKTRKRLLELAVDLVNGSGPIESVFLDTYRQIASLPNSKKLLASLTTVPVRPYRTAAHKKSLERRERRSNAVAQNVSRLTPHIGSLSSGGFVQHLDWAAQLYFRSHSKEGEPSGLELVASHCDRAIADAIAQGWESIACGSLEVSAAEIGATYAQGNRCCVEYPAIAGLDRLLNQGRCPDPATMPIELAIAVLNSGGVAIDSDRHGELEQWALKRLELGGDNGSKALLDYWTGALDAGAKDLSSMWRMPARAGQETVVAGALMKLLADRKVLPLQALRATLHAATSQLEASQLAELADAALADPYLTGRPRLLWSFVAFNLDPAGQAERFISEHSASQISMLFDEGLNEGFVDVAALPDHAKAIRNAVIVRILGPGGIPTVRVIKKRSLAKKTIGSRVLIAINMLAQNVSETAGRLLKELIARPDLRVWHAELRHADAQHSRLRRDHEFRHPTSIAVKAALAGGPPVNAADLRAVVLEELLQLRRELRSSDTSPWRNCWNRNSQGHATTPLNENDCRNYLLDRLRDRLERYKIAASAPEAQRADDTRADVLFVSQAGRNLPLEAKRHYHRKIWTAASTQLQGYAADDGADGFGVYLVFWFGSEVEQAPPRPDGMPGPTSAEELEGMLIADLPSTLKDRTDVVVLDVAKRPSAATAPSSKRTKKATSTNLKDVGES